MYVEIERVARYNREILLALYGDRAHMRCGASVGNHRAYLDASYIIDGDPSERDGFDALSQDDQDRITDDYTRWEAWHSVNGHIL